MTSAHILLKFIAQIRELYNIENMSTPEVYKTTDNENGDDESNDGTNSAEPIIVYPDT